MRNLMLCILFQEKLSWHLWKNLVRSGLSLCEAFSLPPRAIINGAVEYIPTKTIKENVRTEMVPLNTIAQEIASSHMARRTFIGNIYKLVKDPNLVSALTGHVECSRAFSRYRTIDIDMKKDLVKILEGIK